MSPKTDKRMFVRPQPRGLGVGKALGLYERSGYARRGPFGTCAADPLSVFMHKPANNAR